ncbi:aldo/keto reductase [Acidiferrimicrobium sp. IK]|uniref:aldo/keto reductase n=1 Tax=Acidiferrimicrobium sp. IK TaxID=2871700 RepID=UPI0021CB6414|nr:aldo/keto reductase [Acidiferrimicrobium sp. IK]MCU4184055.1 aldo/keto reductase [Acidiferrimicrobium sp. IK]
MRYVKLGRTGVEVSAQCLGTMMFGPMGNPDPVQCQEMVHTALEAGINFVDTADVYSRGQSEEILGAALKGRRDDVVVATKCYNAMSKERNHRGSSRRWITKAVEDSLRRLQTDHIDLYQVHRLDWGTDLDETLGALSDLVRAGKVLYIGSSSYPAEWIVEAQAVAAANHHQRYVTEQPQYSIFARSTEAAVLPTCLRHGIGVLPWSPLAGGWLTGKYRRDAPAPEGARFSPGGLFNRRRGGTVELAEDPRLGLVEALVAVADKAGITMTQLSLAFVAAHPAVTSTIIGPKTPEQLQDLLGAADVVLDDATLDAIDAIIPPGIDAPETEHYVENPGLAVEARRR